MAATLNDHLDYFGATVHKASWALDQAEPGTFVMTKEIAGDPVVAELLRKNGIDLPILAGHDMADPYYGPLLGLDVMTMRPPLESGSSLSKSVARRGWE